MSRMERFRERSAGMNKMENAGAWAVTYWTAEDVHAIKEHHPLTDAEAEGILEHVQGRLHERMVEAGWAMLNEEFAEFIKDRYL